jgi:hypothetical protein
MCGIGRTSLLDVQNTSTLPRPLKATCLMLSPRYMLSPSVYGCELPEGIVLLDVRKDRYIGLSDPRIRHLSQLVANWPANSLGHASCDTDGRAKTAANPIELISLCEELTACGILRRCTRGAEPTASNRTPYLEPAKDFVPDYYGSLPGIGAADLRKFLVSYVTAYVVLRVLSLDFALRYLTRRTSRLRPAPDTTDNLRVIHLVRVFRRIQPYFYSAKDRCLFNGLTLSLFLASHRILPRFVLGVRMDPFAAHCWVQFNDVVFDSTPEDVACFAPILAI